jgi:hypothetical protein
MGKASLLTDRPSELCLGWGARANTPHHYLTLQFKWQESYYTTNRKRVLKNNLKKPSIMLVGCCLSIIKYTPSWKTVYAVHSCISNVFLESNKWPSPFANNLILEQLLFIIYSFFLIWTQTIYISNASKMTHRRIEKRDNTIIYELSTLGFFTSIQIISKKSNNMKKLYHTTIRIKPSGHWTMATSN